jgi:glycosyltransferase involved in cell wall biosynthesis
MKIIGLTRIRNESEIIQDTLDHMSTFCSEVIVYDDCSTDNTVDICNEHPIVSTIIKGAVWSPDRYKEEYANRHELYVQAKKKLLPNDWFVYMDADERIEFDFSKLESFGDKVDAVWMKLFDFYITEDDKDLSYIDRKWMGPEYRNIGMIFRAGTATGWHYNDQRICSTNRNIFVFDGFVKHYGKAISIKEWEKTCNYYATHFPEPYKTKWTNRKGKAIHTISDFGRPLITWEQKEISKHLYKIH